MYSSLYANFQQSSEAAFRLPINNDAGWAIAGSDQTAKLCGKKPLKNIKLTKEPIILPGKNLFMGDYIGLSAVNGRGFAAVTSYNDEIREACIQLIDWPLKLKKVK